MRLLRFIFPKWIIRKIEGYDEYGKLYQEESNEYNQYLIFCTNYAVICALISVAIYLLVDYLKLCEFEHVYIPFIIYILNFIAFALILVTSVFTSILASFILNRLFAINQLINNKEEEKKSKFSDFFGSKRQKDKWDKSLENVVIVLPCFISEKFRNLNDTGVETKVVEQIQTFGKDNKRLLDSIEIFRDLASSSFAQTDVVAASTVVANFSKMNMILPTIRNDVYSFAKFLCPADFDPNEKEKKDSFIHDIKKKMSNIEFQKNNKKGGEQKGLDDILDHIRGSGRDYTTYISIGMFSNIFTMDIINKAEEDYIVKERYFQCIHEIDIINEADGGNKKVEAKRFITINSDSTSERTIDTRKIALTKDPALLDYALIARLNCRSIKKNIIIVGGITGQATQAAALYLFENWEKIYDAMKSEESQSFALILEVERDKTDLSHIAKKQPFLAYPDFLKTTLDFKRNDRIKSMSAKQKV